MHFVLIGAALFGARMLRVPSAPARQAVARAPIVLSAERIRVMQTDFVQRWGPAPTAEQMTALLEQAIEEEVLYREARALAFDFEDRSVRRRLLEKMRVVSDRPARSQEDLVREARALGLDDDAVIRRLLIEKMRLFLAQGQGPQAPPSDTELQHYLERHRDRFLQPPEATFSHVFLSASTHADHLETDAQVALAHLRSQSPAAATAEALSDPFALGLEIRAYSRGRLIARFGKPFAEQVFGLPPGRWSDPIASPYGLHLVWVEEKTEPRLPELATIRQQVAEAVAADRAAQRLAQGLARLRGLYEIRVEGRDDLSIAGTAPASHS